MLSKTIKKLLKGEKNSLDEDLNREKTDKKKDNDLVSSDDIPSKPPKKWEFGNYEKPTENKITNELIDVGSEDVKFTMEAERLDTQNYLLSPSSKRPKMLDTISLNPPLPKTLKEIKPLVLEKKLIGRKFKNYVLFLNISLTNNAVEDFEVQNFKIDNSNFIRN